MPDPIPNIKDTKELNKELSVIENTLTSISTLLTSKITEAFAEVEDSTKTISQIYANNLEKSIKSMARNSDAILKNTLGILAGDNKSKDIQKQLLNIDISKLAQERNIQMLKDNGLIDDIESLRLQADLTEQYKAQKSLLESQNKLTGDIAKKVGLTGALLGEANKIPIVGKFIDSKEALASMNAEAAKDSSTKFSVLAKGINSVGKSLSKNLTDPLTIITFFIQAVNKADQQATTLAKSLGVSKDQAYQLRENFVGYSRAVNDGFINTDRLAKAQAELSEQLGIAVQYSGEELSTFAKLTEITGLSAQEAGKLASFSATTNVDVKDYVKQLRVSSFYAQQANKVHFSDKEILQDVSKLSAGILVKFQNNPKALAAAVVQAKALGLTLEQVDKAGESLLNFESSIENELKAELITGKQLNFERARAAALTGDQAALMQEVASQTGTLAEFQDMNVIAQKSLAEAFGMSRDELADMLMKQEAITKYGSKAAELNKEQLEYMKEHNLSADQMLDKITNQRSVQDKFNDAMLKLQDIIGNLAAGPLGKFVSYLAEGLDYVAGIAIAFGSIYTLQKGIALYQRAIALMKGKELAVQIGIAAAWAIANPFTALAGLAIAGGIASLIVSQMSAAPKFAAGGIVTSEINNATIGEAGPEAIIPLNSSKAAGMLGGIDISPLVSAINEVRNAVNALANKPQQAIALHVGPEKLGEIVGRQAETGTNQYQNAYQLA